MKSTTRSMCALALVLALAAAPLAGCGQKSEPEPADDTAQEEQVVSDPATQDDGAEAVEDATQAAAGNASGTIDAGDFTFQIPAYWENKVDCMLTQESDGTTAAIISLPGNPDAELARYLFVEGDAAEIAGDIGRHLTGQVSNGAGYHVEVWTTNWPWLVASEAAGHSMGLTLDADSLALLVDLSTGGSVSYDDAVAAGPDSIGSAEAKYTGSELASTIAFG